MKIKKLHLKNFRCFEDFEVEFNTGDETHGGLTVLVARNGQGKTALLDAIRTAFGTFTSAFDYPSTKHIASEEIHIETKENTIQSNWKFPVEIHAEGEIEKQDVQWHRELSRENGRTTIKFAKVITEYGKRLKKALTSEKAETVVLPLVAYYGTGRLWVEHRNTGKDTPLLRPRDYGYYYALDTSSNYGIVSQWLTNAIQQEISEKLYSLRKDEVLSGQLEAIRGALKILLSKEGYLPILHINQKFKTLAILSPAIPSEAGKPSYNSIPISFLSDGVRCAFSQVTDIAFRCAQLNPNLGAKACEETPGIVLIDEVDMHLHPAWQQKILPALQSIFPKIQFIVTTHSPQVISSVPAECVRIIDDGRVYAAVGTAGADSGRVLKRVFGTEAYPADNPARRKLMEYLGLVYQNQWKTPHALELRKELDQIYQGEEPLLFEADLHIENEEWEAAHPGDAEWPCVGEQHPAYPQTQEE